MQGAKDQSCIKCGTQDGTVVRAHYCGMYQQRFGKGTGTKGHDLFGAHLCHRCHTAFDQYIGDLYQRDLEFLVLCCMTIVRDTENNLITIKGWKQ